MKHAGIRPAIGSLLLLLAWVIFPRPNPAAELKIAARGAVLMNAQTGKIIRAHNQDLPLPPASTAKVLTALVVLDQNRTSDVVTLPAEALHVSGARKVVGGRFASCHAVGLRQRCRHCTGPS